MTTYQKGEQWQKPITGNPKAADVGRYVELDYRLVSSLDELDGCRICAQRSTAIPRVGELLTLLAWPPEILKKLGIHHREILQTSLETGEPNWKEFRIREVEHVLRCYKPGTVGPMPLAIVWCAMDETALSKLTQEALGDNGVQFPKAKGDVDETSGTH